MKKLIDLSGSWTLHADGLGTFPATLPGTLDTNGIGIPDTQALTTRLTRVHTWEGEARFTRRVSLPDAGGGFLLLEAERARQLRLLADGAEVPVFQAGTLSTPYIFDLSGWAGKETELCLLSDNRYLGWPREAILGSSAATDETQTNWNGVLGYLRLRIEPDLFIEQVRLYPHGDGLEIQVGLCGKPELLQSLRENDFSLCVSSDAFLSPVTASPEVPADGCSNGRLTVTFSSVPLCANSRRWDEYEGNLYEASASLTRGGVLYSEKSVRFGLRTFGAGEGPLPRLTLNGRVFFLRGEANCCEFPETGHPPMTVEEWRRVLSVYSSYGVNCVRFHSHCPPEAAFAAADELGILMQPELSQWDCHNAFGDTISESYYRLELLSILRELANHPSFVMLTFGNELAANAEGVRRMNDLLALARATDATRLYANASNYKYGAEGPDPHSDFYTSSNNGPAMIRATNSPLIGHLNQEPPSASHHYSGPVSEALSAGGPVFSFEVGQYEILPDFEEIADFRGVTRAENLRIFKERAEAAGFINDWPRRVEATGELSLLCYREEVEAVLRTPEMSGISLLGLQDFPGQGTALVGMLDSHLRPKAHSFASPSRFRSFFNDVVLLALLPGYTFTEGASLDVPVKLANYGKKPLSFPVRWELLSEKETLQAGVFPEAVYENQGLRAIGELRLALPKSGSARALRLHITAGLFETSYPLWVYPDLPAFQPAASCFSGACPSEPGIGNDVIFSRELTEGLLDALEAGAFVLLEPEPTPERLPSSIAGQFSTDFWSVGTFAMQPGGMGLLIDPSHPALEGFPTAFHSNYQWWPMACGRPMVLPPDIVPILTVPDSVSRMRNMGLLFECSVGKGRLLVSSMGLSFRQEYPQCRALLSCLLNYLHGTDAAQMRRVLPQLSRETLFSIAAPLKSCSGTPSEHA